MRDDIWSLETHYANMAKQPRQRWFLKAWRQYRGYTQERLAEMIGSSKGYISDLEKDKRRYNQELLEGLAEALRCSPGDLLTIDPTTQDSIWSIWETLRPVERDQAVEVIKALKRTGTDG